MKTTTNLLEHITDEMLLKALPHGSGIDAEWIINDYGDRITCENSYHGMNECGMYDGWADFTVTLFAHKEDVLNLLKGPCAGQVQIVHSKGDIDWTLSLGVDDDDDRDFVYGLNEYLGDTIQCALSEAKIIK